MNNIKTSDIVDPSIQQPFTGPSLAFLQAAYTESIYGLAVGIVGDNMEAQQQGGAGVVVSGCVRQGFMGDVISGGYVLYNNELFYMNLQVGMNSYTDVPVVILSASQGANDPVTFSDGIARNVHNVRQLVIVDQPSGTGLFDLDDIGRLVHYQATNASSSTSGTGRVDLLTYTAPTGRNPILRVTVSGDLSFLLLTGPNEGGKLILRNDTAAVDYHYSQMQAQSSIEIPVAFTYNITMAAGAVLKLQLQRLFTDDILARNVVMTISEIPPLASL